MIKAILVLFLLILPTKAESVEVCFENSLLLSSYFEDYNYQNHENSVDFFRTELDNIWKKEGFLLINETEKALDTKFSRKIFHAYIVNKKKAPLGISSPLIININKIENFTNTALSENIKIFLLDTLYHEILHNYIVENFNIANLVKNFKNEEKLTRNHIYLYAIQKCIYKNLERKDLLNVIKKNKNPEYQRAIDIVDGKCEIFIEELKRNRLL